MKGEQMSDIITRNAEERDKMQSAIHNAICIFEQNTGLIVKGIDFSTEVARTVGGKALSVHHYSFLFDLEIAE